MHCTDYPAAPAPSSLPQLSHFPWEPSICEHGSHWSVISDQPQERGSRAAMLLLLRGNRDKSHGPRPWTGSSTAGKGLAGICLAEAEGTGDRRQEHSRSLNEPPRFCTRFRPRVLCKDKRRACCGYHTPEALGKLFQEKGELPVPVNPHHPVLSAWLLSELCLPYPGDSAFTSCNQGHAQNHSVPALLLPNLSHTWTLPALESPFPQTCFTHVCVRLEPLSGPAPPCKHPAACQELNSTPHKRHVSNSRALQGPAASAGDTELPKAPVTTPGSANQLQN